MILEGIKVVDFTQYLAGPVVTRMMAELGADIIKIEQGPNGDPTRTLPIMKNGRSGYFVQQSLGKKSICLDFDKPQSRGNHRIADRASRRRGRELFETRGREAAASITRVSKKSIHALSSHRCPRSVAPRTVTPHKTGYDWIAQAFTGVMHMTGPKDSTPHPVGVGIADSNAGVHAFSAIGYALFHRERTGRGQYLDISMVDALFHMNEITLQGYCASDGAYQPMRSGAHHPLVCPCGVYKSAEGYMVLLVLQNQWQNLCDAMGKPELANDPRFVDQDSRAKNQAELIPMIESWLQSFDSDAEAWSVMEEFRVPSGPVMNPKDTIDHEYYRGRGSIRTVNDPFVGEMHLPGFPLRFSEQAEYNPGAVPALGEHNEEILREFLDYSDEQINELQAQGVLMRSDR